MNNNVIVLGGDGFCGWPAALHLSNQGYDVTIVDNLVRRKTDIELESNSLTPIKSMSDRVDKWKELTGKEIEFYYFDISEHYHRLLNLLKEKQPRAVVHFAEQRAAPYSQKSSFHKRYTVDNNLNATNNLLASIVEADLEDTTHVVHLGTTGTAGYSSFPMPIPEGFIDVKVPTDEGEITMEMPWPLHSPSIYHLTKSQDFLTFQFYNQNDKISITDLRQGIVWGCQTQETKLHEDLINRWDYDFDYGTVLNRFLIQSQVEHPLTVYGTGGQTRAFIHLQDSVKCVQLAIENPPSRYDKVKVINQVTECLNVRDLAEKVKELTGAQIRYYKNQREEAVENQLRMSNQNLLDMGLDPIKLDDRLLEEVINIAGKYKDRCDLSKIITDSRWSKGKEVDKVGSDEPIKE